MEFVPRSNGIWVPPGEYDVPFEYEVPVQKHLIGRSKVNLFVVAVECAFGIKAALLQDVKTKTTLKLRSISATRPSIPTLKLKSRFPVVAEWLAPLVLLYLFLHQMMGPAFFSSQWFFGVPGDTTMFMWFIGWMWHAILLGHSPIVSDALRYPHPINIMAYTSVPSLGLLFGWLSAFTTIVFIYNLIVVVNYTLIFVFGKLTLRVLGIGPLFSGIGGFLFCLMPYLTAQGLMHLHLAVISPLFIVGYLIARLTRSARQPGWAFGVIIGFALTLAFYTSLETFSTMALCIIILYGSALACSFKSTYDFTLRLLNLRFLLGVIAPLLLLVPGLLNFVQSQGSAPLVLEPTAILHSSDALSLLVPSQFYLVHSEATTRLAAHFTGDPYEWNGYLSVPFIILFIVYATRGWQKPVTQVLTYATLCMAVLSLGPNLHIAGVEMHFFMPWIILLHIPFIRDALPARLALYVAYLAIILVVGGIDDSAKQSPMHLRPLKLPSGQVVNLAALALVLLLWLPLLPTYSSTMPVAASILRTDQVVPRYIAQVPTMVLYEPAPDDGFCVVMGMLAASDNYGLVASNDCSSAPSVRETAWNKLNKVFIHDTDGKQTELALRQYLPQLGVGRVMFLSVDNRPISSQQTMEISQVLGSPLYNREGLVVVWTVPQNIGS